jgi:putative flippase GtrA
MNTDFFSVARRYVIIGLITIVIDYTLLFFMSAIIRLEASLSIIVAYLISAIFNYLFHRKYTFVSTSNIASEIVKYILIAVSMAYLTVYIVMVLMDVGISIYLGKLVAVLVVFTMTFFISKYFIYYQKIQ